jgi:DNA-binding transcriptional ArsR family regulator
MNHPRGLLVLTFDFSAHDLARTRFATSPMQEIVASIRVLKEPTSHPLHEPWAEQTRVLLRQHRLDLAPLADLVPVPSWYIPDFLTPPPDSPTADFPSQLDLLRTTPLSQVTADLARMVVVDTPWLRSLREDPAAGLRRLADVIEEYWNLAIAPHWPRLHALQQGDVLYRARRLADGGAAMLFEDLAPIVRWHEDRLYVAHPRYGGSCHLNGQGLLLVPSVFVWPSVFSSTIEPWQPSLTYPARGVASLWRSGERSDRRAIAAVIGRSRAVLLAELESPASTTELALRTGLAAGSVSEHLTALRSAGLVTAYRNGRFVLYTRTAVGEALLTAPATHGHRAARDPP